MEREGVVVVRGSVGSAIGEGGLAMEVVGMEVVEILMGWAEVEMETEGEGRGEEEMEAAEKEEEGTEEKGEEGMGKVETGKEGTGKEEMGTEGEEKEAAGMEVWGVGVEEVVREKGGGLGPVVWGLEEVCCLDHRTGVAFVRVVSL